MTQDFENMLYLFANNANNAKLNISGELNIEKIRKYSLEQGIWTMVYSALAKVCDMSQYQGEFWAMISGGIARKEFTLGIIQKLQAEGVRCCLLKGATLSELYADKECRISGDADILIDPEDEERLKEILSNNGYVVEERKKNDHHLSAYHKTGGLLEAHVMLYGHMTSQVVFNGLEMYNEPWTKMEINGKTFNTLGINDGLMYLTAHYIKHLVNSGGGVRQMMDLLLYIEKYKDEIDFDRYEDMLKKLNYHKLVAVLKSIGGKYFGFAYEVKEEKLAVRLLEDTQNGGIFGFSTDDRKNFYDLYCKKRTDLSRIKYYALNISKAEQSILFKLFPGKEILIQCGYKYAEKTIAIPIAWVHRLINILLRRISKKSTPSENNARLQLMRDMDMI